jgi:uncharacterized protein (TIGR00725 family)
MEKTYIGVIGGSSCNAEIAVIACSLGRLIAEHGWVLVCGGMGGVMEAACKGAYEAGGVTLGILPGNDRTEGNTYLTYSVVTALGHARNLMVAQSSTALVAVGGSFGTLSEISFANILGKPLVGLKSWRAASRGGSTVDPSLLFRAEVETAEQAIAALKGYL